MGALEDPPFVASLLDTKAFEEVLGALKTTGLSAIHIANMWSMKGGSSGADNSGSALAVESTEASHPDADSE
nr:hypothetical protein [Tanacetum cinerariifolium]